MTGLYVKVLHSGYVCAPGEIGEINLVTADGNQVRTGELGWLDVDGYLYVTGRVQGLLCRNGVNFSADRIIQTALMLPATEQPDQIHFHPKLPRGPSGKIDGPQLRDSLLKVFNK